MRTAILTLALVVSLSALALGQALSVVDQAGGPALEASSDPVMGQLFPLSDVFMVDFERGRVGINKVEPDTSLFVYGNQRIWWNGLLKDPTLPGASWVGGGLQYSNLTYTRGWCADYTGFQSYGGTLELNARGVFGVHAADTLFVEPNGTVGIGRTPDSSFALDVAGNIRTDDTIVSTKPAGAPFVITSTDVTANLNADLLDGMNADEIIAAARAESGTTATTSEFPVDAISFVGTDPISAAHMTLDGSRIEMSIPVEVDTEYFAEAPDPKTPSSAARSTGRICLTSPRTADGGALRTWFEEVALGNWTRRDGELAVSTATQTLTFTLLGALPVRVSSDTDAQGRVVDVIELVVERIELAGTTQSEAIGHYVFSFDAVNLFYAETLEIEGKEVIVTADPTAGLGVSVGDIRLGGVHLDSLLDQVYPEFEATSDYGATLHDALAVTTRDDAEIVAVATDAFASKIHGFSLRTGSDGVTRIVVDEVTYTVTDVDTAP